MHTSPRARHAARHGFQRRERPLRRLNFVKNQKRLARNDRRLRHELDGADEMFRRDVLLEQRRHPRIRLEIQIHGILKRRAPEFFQEMRLPDLARAMQEERLPPLRHRLPPPGQQLFLQFAPHMSTSLPSL